MCRITLIPIIKPPVQDEPHPQTALSASRPNDQVLSPEELQYNDQYLSSHGLPPEPELHFPASSNWPAHVTPVGGPYPPACLFQPPIPQYTSTVITFQQEHGFVPGCRPPVFCTPGFPAAAYGTRQQPHLPSGFSCYPVPQPYPENPAPPLRCSAKNGIKPFYPALVPDRVVPRSQHNLSPVKVPSNYGVKAYYCEMVLTQYQIYHTQRLREAEPEPRKMPHLCTFEYGTSGNVFWQDGRHVEEGEAGKVMSPESYIDGLMAEDVKGKKVEVKPGRRSEKGTSRDAPVERLVFANSHRAASHVSSSQSFTQPGEIYIDPLSPQSQMLALMQDGSSSANHQAPEHPQRMPSPRHVPAEHEVLATSQDEVTAAIQKLIGVDEHWNPVETFAQTRTDMDCAELGLAIMDRQSSTAQAESSRAGLTDERMPSAPYTRRRKASEERFRGRGKGKAATKKAFRRGHKAATHMRPEQMQYTNLPHHPSAWHLPATISSTPFPPVTTDLSPLFQAPVTSHSAAYIYTPAFPDPPNTPTEMGFSNLSILDPASPKAPGPAQLFQASPPSEKSEPAALPILPPERPMSCLPPLTIDQDRETARRGLGNRRSRASTTSLPCDLWSVEPESETPVTPWTATLMDRTKV